MNTFSSKRNGNLSGYVRQWETTAEWGLRQKIVLCLADRRDDEKVLSVFDLQTRNPGHTYPNPEKLRGLEAIPVGGKLSVGLPPRSRVPVVHQSALLNDRFVQTFSVQLSFLVEFARQLEILRTGRCHVVRMMLDSNHYSDHGMTFGFIRDDFYREIFHGG
jgi:hypothetical protein